MVINFNGGGGVTPAQVQEMINAALDFTTGVINLATATDAEVKSAFTDPDRWLFSCTYSGATYIEQRRHIGNSGDTYVYFYVPAAQAENDQHIIFDREYWVKIIPQTGVRTFPTTDAIVFVPDVIYNLDRMNAAQIAALWDRIHFYTVRDNNRFTVKWMYNNRRYVYIAGQVSNTPYYDSQLCGTALEIVNNEIVVYYDIVSLYLEGDIAHKEYTSNITLTPVPVQP